MIQLALHLTVTAALLMLVAKFVRGVDIRGWGPAFLAAVSLGLVNAIVRPLMVLLTFPITLLTFGLFLLVVNTLTLWLAMALVPGVRIEGFTAAFLGSLLLTLMNLVIGMAFGI